MYTYDEVHRFSRGHNDRVKNGAFPVRNPMNISRIRYMQERLTSQNKFIVNTFYKLDCEEQNYCILT